MSNRFVTRLGAVIAALVAALMVAAACESADPTATPRPAATLAPSATPVPTTDPLENAEIVLYSGRNRNLVEPAIEAFIEATGINVRARYASTGAVVAAILEEGDNTPADVVLLQDAGALGALSLEGRLQALPAEFLDRVDSRYRSPKGEWIGTSGRARVVAYNTDRLSPDDLPTSILDYTDPKWKGRIGWAPPNASFQAFISALRVQMGEDRARDWIRGIVANEPIAYSNNINTVAAVAQGEVDVGFVNHYYLYRFLEAQGEDFKARNHFYGDGDPGALVNVAGVGVIRGTDDAAAVHVFVDWMLSEEAQAYFATQTFEFPLVEGIASPEGVPPLSTLDPPDIDLSDLEDLRGTQDLLRDEGVLS